MKMVEKLNTQKTIMEQNEKKYEEFKKKFQKDKDKLKGKAGEAKAKSQMKKSEAMNNRNNEKAKPVSKCEKCDFKAVNKAFLEDHIKKDHSITTYKCNKCEFVANDKKTLRCHKDNLHKSLGSKCEDCGDSSETDIKLREHMSVKHKSPRIGCTSCGEKIESNEALEKHIRKVHAKKVKDATTTKKGYKFPCLKCEFTCKREAVQKEHQKSKHSKTSIKCSQCDFTATSKDVMDKHMTIAMSHKRDTPCRFFLNNSCRKGTMCRFSHVVNKNSINQQCQEYAFCKKFPSCDMEHNEICKFQQKCRKGSSCMYVHLKPSTF